jgi:hypothetical protein
MTYLLFFFLFSGCSNESGNNTNSGISQTGTERIAIFREHAMTNINSQLDDVGHEAIDKANIRDANPDRKGAEVRRQDRAASLSLWFHTSCANQETYVPSKWLHDYMIPEEGGIECLNVDAPTAFIACTRNNYEAQIKGFQRGVSVSILKEADADDTKAPGLVTTSARIAIFDGTRMRKIGISVFDCPKNASLDVCFFDYSPSVMIPQACFDGSILDWELSTSLSPSEDDATIAEKVLRQISTLEPERVLAVLVRKRIYTTDENFCMPAQLYTIS